MAKYVVALIVLVALISAGVDYSYQNEFDVTATSGEDTTAGLLAEENAVVVSEQRPGTTATASLIVLTSPGFLVIHDDVNGAPGAILGSSALLQAGQSSNVEVTLSRATRDGERLHAMLHSDTDATGTFTASSDLPVQSRLGGPIEGWLDISSSASLGVPFSI